MLDKGEWLHAEKAPDATTDPITGEVRTRKLAQLASIGAGARVAKN